MRPGVCVPQGGIDITLDGSNFCTRRGVFVRFGETVSRAHTIGAKRVVVTVPPLPDTVAQTLTARCEPLARGLTVAVTRSAAVDLCVSNNGRDFAPVRAEGGFRYELKLPDVRLPPDVQVPSSAALREHRPRCGGGTGSVRRGGHGRAQPRTPECTGRTARAASSTVSIEDGSVPPLCEESALDGAV